MQGYESKFTFYHLSHNEYALPYSQKVLPLNKQYLLQALNNMDQTILLPSITTERGC